MNNNNHFSNNFENDIFRYQSYLEEFLPNVFEEFDLKFKQIGINSKINDLYEGKNINITENQAALHPKYRDNSQRYLKGEKYFKLLESAKNIISIGIGGSYEGPKLLIECEGNTRANHIFLTGSDSSEFKDKIKKILPDETVFIVSSKSFTTEETIEVLRSAIDWSGDMSKFIAVTANRSEASKYGIENIVEFDKEIGGRYSIWSDISLAAHSENIKEYREQFISGGKEADIDLKTDEDYFKFLKTLSFSDIWLHNYKNKNTRVVLSYIWKFRSLPSYIQQLEMESLGKQPSKKSDFKKTGQIIFGGYGPTAQHSYFQLLHQGTHQLCADIIVSEEHANSLALAQAETQSKLLSNGVKDIVDEREKINGNIPTNYFRLKKVDAFTLGYLIATWEHRTFITASMLQINPFDQFGVNVGKIYTKKYQIKKD